MPHLGADLRSLLWPGDNPPDTASDKLNSTAVAQPALFCIEYALAILWEEWGIVPKVMIGHSIGEYVAACLADVLSLKDALKLVAMRGKLMQEMPAGSMLSISLSQKETASFLQSHRIDADIAVINGPAKTVVSGHNDTIGQLETRLEQEGIVFRRLHTSHAFHSQMMEPMLDRFAEVTRTIALNPPRIPYLSNLTGTWITEKDLKDPDYWVRHLRRTVRFSNGLEELLKEPDWVLLEVGPGTSLKSLANQHPQKSPGQIALASLPHPNDRRVEDAFILETLGELWLQGAAVDWPAFSAGEKRSRLELPAYPFERQSYWVEQSINPFTGAASGAGEPVMRKSQLNDWFYIPSWKRSKPLDMHESLDGGERCWLIFSDESGLAQQLTRELEKQNHRCISVTAGSEFQCIDEGREYVIHPGTPDHYRDILKALQSLEQAPDVILNMWAVTSEPRTDSPLEDLETIRDRYFFSLLHLSQAIGELAITPDSGNPIQLAIIANHLHDVTGDEFLMPEKALLTGPCRVIPLEYRNIDCRVIDIVLPSDIQAFEPLVNNIISEMSVRSTDSVVALRGSSRWVETWEPVHLKAADSPLELREQGVYLITGGLTQTGLVFARHLAAFEKPVTLVLLTPDPFPPKEEWETYAQGADQSDQADETDETGKTIALLQDLEENGSRVIVYQADIADTHSMQAMADDIRERFGGIHGVLHTDDIPGEGLSQLKTREQVERVMAPKVTGTLVLDSLFSGSVPDFFILFSSGLSVSGGLGQIDYCAANAFIDAYARAGSVRYDSRAPTRIAAVGWGAWYWDDYNERSMAAVPEIRQQLRETRETFGITPGEAGEALDRILSVNLPRVVVSTQDLLMLLEQQNAVTTTSFSDQLREIRTTDGSGGDRDGSYEPPDGELEQTIAEVWQKAFGMERIGRNDNFFDLGGESLLAIQLIGQLRKALDMDDLSLNILFEAPTIAELAQVVNEAQQEYDEDIESLLSEIEGLSPEEVQDMLEEEQNTETGEDSND